MKNAPYTSLAALFASDDAATMVEYAIMVSLIAAVSIALIATLGKSVKSQFSTVSSAL